MANPRHEYKQSRILSSPANDLSIEPRDESEWPETIRVAVRELRKRNVSVLRVWFDESKIAWIIDDVVSGFGVTIDGTDALSSFDAEQVGSHGADYLLDAIGGKK